MSAWASLWDSSSGPELVAGRVRWKGEPKSHSTLPPSLSLPLFTSDFRERQTTLDHDYNDPESASDTSRASSNPLPLAPSPPGSPSSSSLHLLLQAITIRDSLKTRQYLTRRPSARLCDSSLQSVPQDFGTSPA